MPDTPPSSHMPQDRRAGDLLQDREQQRTLNLQAQALSRQARDLERQQAKFEQDKKRAEEQQTRSARMAEEQMARRETQLETEQVKARNQIAAAEANARAADEMLAEASRLKASADAARHRGWWLFALALPVSAAFVWFAWQSNDRQAILERTLAALAADTGQLADDLDDSSKARAELLETVRSLRQSESTTAGQAQTLQQDNAALESRLTTLLDQLVQQQAEVSRLTAAANPAQAEAHAAAPQSMASDPQTNAIDDSEENGEISQPADTSSL